MIIVVFDCTHTNLGAVEQLVGMDSDFAGYDTGIGADIKWTVSDWALHPHAIHIDQDPGASDFTSDVLDIEAGAANVGEAAGWFTKTLANYAEGVRPGQRYPACYASQASITPLANALTAGGITSKGPALIVANWNLADHTAVLDVVKASGPFPIVGVQNQNDGPFDTSFVSAAWFNTVSHAPVTTPPPPATEKGVLVPTVPLGMPRGVVSTDNGVTWKL